jgi:hypothetical protein
MNREDINKFWSEAYVNGMLPFEQREKFARLVAAAEREACANLAEWQERYLPKPGKGVIKVSVAIRARGEQEKTR